MYESSTVDTATGEPIISYAHWRGCSLDDVERILAQLALAPLWPSAFPEGYDPAQVPFIVMLSTRFKDDFSEYRIGDMLSSVKLDNGNDDVYWPTSEGAFSQPNSTISLYFGSKDNSTGFCLRYIIWTPEMIGRHPNTSPCDRTPYFMEAQANGLGISGVEGDRWKQVYVLNANDFQSIRNGNRSADTLMIYYRMLSSTLDLETLKEVARNLIPYEDVFAEK